MADRENLLTEKMFLELHKNIHPELPVSAVHYPVLDNIGSFTCVQGGKGLTYGAHLHTLPYVNTGDE